MMRAISGAFVAGTMSCVVSAAARAQTADDAAQAPSVSAPPSSIGEITVTATRLAEAHEGVAANVGASSYALSNQSIEAMPSGDNASLSQVLLQAPGVAQDNLANGAIHIRNEHLNAQYRINGVMLPDGVSFFGQGISPRFIQSMNLIDGALPAQYGLRTAGVIDITTKSDVYNNGGSVEMYGGSYWTLQPSLEYGGDADGYDYFVSGDFQHNDHGINSPTASYDAVHDETNQEHGFGYVEKKIDATDKVSAILGSFFGRFQIPNNPGQTPAFSVNGSTNFDSNALDENQDESANFGVLSFSHTEENFTYQVAGYSKYSTLYYSPDIYGDLAFGGVAEYALRQDVTNGIQADSSYKLTDTHTLRGGVLMNAERSSADTTSWVECTAAPCPGSATVGDTPFPIVDNSAKTGWTYSAYLQDEWKLLPTVTVNYGGRFDVVNTSTMENQLSPRLNTVWNPTPSTTVHAGYANYFTPPPFDSVSMVSPNTFADTTANATGVTQNSPVKAERSQVFDVGITQDVDQVPGLKLGIDTYYKYARNLIDEGQFGAPIILTPFNYHVGYTKGVELTTSYDHGPFSYYGNLSIGTEKAEGITSAQYNFTQADLDYISGHLINTDHSQLMTASAGMSYLWLGTSYSVDLVAGTGVRTQEANNTIPNGGTVPSYEQVNFGVSHKFDAPGGPIEIRADLINAFDEVYLIREQSGIGVNAPQYGPRRTVYLGVRKYF